MKAIEDMTINEFKELKEKTLDEFRELVRNFFETHPMINIIHLYYNYRKEFGLWPIDSETHYYGSSIPLTMERIDSAISNISFKNEPKV